jgi:hypothetical protein
MHDKVEFGLLPSFVHNRQISVLLRREPFQIDRAMRGSTMGFWPQPCGRTGPADVQGGVGIRVKPPESLRNGLIFSPFPLDPRPVVKTGITVCIHLGSTGRSSLLQCLFGEKAKPGLQATSGASRKHRYNPFEGVEMRSGKVADDIEPAAAKDELQIRWSRPRN